MQYFILAIALASILLIGCSFGGTVEERQKRAEDLLESTAANITAGLEEAKDAAGDLHSGIADTVEKLESAAETVQKTAEGIQDGVEKIAGAVQTGREGVDQIRDTIHISGDSTASSIGEIE